MKNFITNIKIITIGFLTFFLSCVEEPDPFAIDASPGFSASIDDVINEISFTKNADETVVGEVNVSGIWTTTSNGTLDRLIVTKTISTADNEEIEVAIHDRDLAIGEDTPFTITSVEELLDGFEINPEDLAVGSKFILRVQGVKPSGDIITLRGGVTLPVDYFGYCEIPDLELGTWTVTNKETNYSKDVELGWDPVNEVYYFTDFGIDWSWWDDFWYGASFRLSCPLVEGNPVEVSLYEVGWQSDRTSSVPDEFEMLDDSGNLDTRVVRFLFKYQDGSNKGYYDENSGELVFQEVGVTNIWWAGTDTHTINISFKKK